MSVGVSIFTREETTTVKNLTKIIVSAGLAAGLAAAALTASAVETWYAARRWK